jgi:RNA polymerase sigma-70 factor, ECF subfamily
MDSCDACRRIFWKSVWHAGEYHESCHILRSAGSLAVGSDHPNSKHSEHLLAAARSGDASSLWALTDAFRPYLKALVERMLTGRLSAKVDASDVVQQAMVAAIDHFAQFRGDDVAEWYGWCVHIVRNEVLNLIRYWHQDVRDVDREQAIAPELGGPGMSSDGSSPSKQASNREEAARLIRAVDQLPPDYRQVIELRNLGDLPFADVAARMGRTQAAVRQLWVRALQQLKRELGVNHE